MNITQYIYNFETKNPQGFNEEECFELIKNFTDMSFEDFEKKFLYLYPKEFGTDIWLRCHVSIAIKNLLNYLELKK